MNTVAQPAYNLRDFDRQETEIKARKKTTQKATTKKVVQKKQVKAINWAPVKGTVAATVFSVLLFSVLYSNAQMTQLTADIAQKRAELTELQSEYDYLDSVMQANASARIVESYATSELGLIRIDSNQIEYIVLQGEDSLETVQAESVWTILKRNFLNITEYVAA